MQIVYDFHLYCYTFFLTFIGNGKDKLSKSFAFLHDVLGLGKLFSGFHILAYCYVRWAMDIPEMLASLQIPFGKEYDIAKGMIN